MKSINQSKSQNEGNVYVREHKLHNKGVWQKINWKLMKKPF